MTAEVRLTIAQGTPEGKTFTFRARTVGTMGRADDCLLRLPGDMAHLDVSRHHCLLEIDPPLIRVRDLGSKNGTFVNGANIGQRSRGLSPEAAAYLDMPERTLGDGDELRVGGTVFRVGVTGEEPPARPRRRKAGSTANLVGQGV
jgi:pSer/pThr/pTyr-binding forkhead associated (FHA) protein